MDEMNFDAITPDAESRPEWCPVCKAREEQYFGRLNFRRSGSEWPDQYCPMHRKAIKQGTMSLADTRLVFA